MSMAHLGTFNFLYTLYCLQLVAKRSWQMNLARENHILFLCLQPSDGRITPQGGGIMNTSGKFHVIMSADREHLQFKVNRIM